MLDEWIRYVEDPKSRIIVSPDMGPSWASILKVARTGELRSKTDGFEDVARQWRGFIGKETLRLRAKLGVDVKNKVSRREKKDGKVQLLRLMNEASSQGGMSGTFTIPDAAGDLSVELFLQSRKVRYTLDVKASTEGRQKRRVGWIVRQLARLPNVPSDLTINAIWTARGLETSAPFRETALTIDQLLESKGKLVPKDAMPRRFLLQRVSSFAKGRSTNGTHVLEGISRDLEDFYRNVAEGIRPFVARAPRLPKRKRSVPAPTADVLSESETAPENSSGL